jgi:hypothetical protein
MRAKHFQVNRDCRKSSGKVSENVRKTKHIILRVWIQIGIRTKNSPFLFEKQKNNNVFAYFIFINEKVKKLNLNVK